MSLKAPQQPIGIFFFALGSIIYVCFMLQNFFASQNMKITLVKPIMRLKLLEIASTFSLTIAKIKSNSRNETIRLLLKFKPVPKDSVHMKTMYLTDVGSVVSVTMKRMECEC